jgi:DNA replication licensing factor MCM4
LFGFRRLMSVALQKAAWDPKTGTVDMDLIFTGRSASARSRLVHLAEETK